MNRALQAGLDYVFHIPGVRPMNLLQSIGNGCAFLDYDNDGNLDILLVGNPVPRLFRGDGKGHFKDVSQQTGFLPTLPAGAQWVGCAVGDIDNDGYPDIYLSGYRCGALFHNLRGEKFVDITAQAGLVQNQRFGASCGFADLSGSGRLDLYIGNYVVFDVQSKFMPAMCKAGDIPTGCPPGVYWPEKPQLYRNLGHCRFQDVTVGAGLLKAHGAGLGVSFLDINDNGRMGIFQTNDTRSNDLFENQGNGHFVEKALKTGVAVGPDGHVQAGMGIDLSDYDNDGRLDAVVVTFENDSKSLYHNEGTGLFRNVGIEAGLGAAAAPYVSFGVKWLDYDNDGWPDLMITSGHIQDNIEQIDNKKRYRCPMQIFRNIPGTPQENYRRFADVSEQMGTAITQPIVGRGLATGDYDNDGRMDALAVDSEGAPLLLHNEGGKVGHWIGLNLVGTGKSNRDAYGALVIVRAGGRNYVRQVQTAGSFLSASDKRLVFGIGAAKTVTQIGVRWPDGKKQMWSGLSINHYYPLRERR